jgi:SPP1 gp7 family putative phage head morphogenesis protein
MKRPNQLVGKPLNYPAGVAARYAKSLTAQTRMMAKAAEGQIVQLFEDQFKYGDIADSARILTDHLMQAFAAQFDALANRLPRTFAAEVDKSSYVALRNSMSDIVKDPMVNVIRLPPPLYDRDRLPVPVRGGRRGGSSGNGGGDEPPDEPRNLREEAKKFTLSMQDVPQSVKDTLNAVVAENVALIRNIPQEYMTQVQGAVMRSITTGNGLADLQPFLKKREVITKRRAELIAIDQTRKAFSALNTIRMKEAGVQEFKWLHSHGGQYPRKLHLKLNNTVHRLDDPPVIDDRTGERGMPGMLISCRCRACVVLTFGKKAAQ